MSDTERMESPREVLSRLVEYWDWGGYDAMRENELREAARAVIATTPRDASTFHTAGEVWRSWMHERAKIRKDVQNSKTDQDPNIMPQGSDNESKLLRNYVKTLRKEHGLDVRLVFKKGKWWAKVHYSQDGIEETFPIVKGESFENTRQILLSCCYCLLIKTCLLNLLLDKINIQNIN